MPKKPTKKSLRNKLDKLVKQIVRKRKKCQHCGRSRGIQLQTAHIFSRKYLGLRWNLDNVLLLCASCHFWAHSNTILFAEWVKEYLGEEKYQLLKEARNQITIFTLNDLQIKVKALEELLQKGEIK